MKKPLPALLLWAVAVPLVVAASASATAVRVAIDEHGFSPATVKLQAGDSITWTNKDDKKHRAVCKACPFTSQVLGEGDSYSYVFLKVGTFTVADPLNGNKKLTVKVRHAAATVQVTAKPAVITYGLTSTISGSTSSAKAGQKVEIFAFPCLGPNEKLIATLKTTRRGTYTFRVHPSKMTAYHSRYTAKSGTVSSSSVSVAVKPLITLERVGRGRFTVALTAGRSFVGKAVAIQRFVGPKQRKWVTARTVMLTRKRAGAKPEGATVTSAAFRSRLPAGVRVRALLRPLQAVPCYLTATSRAITT
jgi:plastocyanin